MLSVIVGCETYEPAAPAPAEASPQTETPGDRKVPGSDRPQRQALAKLKKEREELLTEMTEAVAEVWNEYDAWHAKSLEDIKALKSTQPKEAQKRFADLDAKDPAMNQKTVEAANKIEARYDERLDALDKQIAAQEKRLQQSTKGRDAAEGR